MNPNSHGLTGSQLRTAQALVYKLQFFEMSEHSLRGHILLGVRWPGKPYPSALTTLGERYCLPARMYKWNTGKQNTKNWGKKGLVLYPALHYPKRSRNSLQSPSLPLPTTHIL
ncbi:UNVERIFIED_CONTAM: hypothetical protein K2H54_021944 [Gekko kuhli]